MKEARIIIEVRGRLDAGESLEKIREWLMREHGVETAEKVLQIIGDFRELRHDASFTDQESAERNQALTKLLDHWEEDIRTLKEDDCSVSFFERMKRILRVKSLVNPAWVAMILLVVAAGYMLGRHYPHYMEEGKPLNVYRLSLDQNLPHSPVVRFEVEKEGDFYRKFGSVINRIFDQNTVYASDYMTVNRLEKPYELTISHDGNKAFIELASEQKLDREVLNSLILQTFNLDLESYDYQDIVIERFDAHGETRTILALLRMLKNSSGACIEAFEVYEGGKVPLRSWRPDAFCPYETQPLPNDAFTGNLDAEDLNGDGIPELIAVMHHIKEPPCVMAILDFELSDVKSMLWNYGSFNIARILPDWSTGNPERIFLTGEAASAVFLEDHVSYPFLACVKTDSLFNGGKNRLPLFERDRQLGRLVEERYEPLRELIAGNILRKNESKILGERRAEIAEEYREKSSEATVHEIFSESEPSDWGSGYEWYVLFPPLDPSRKFIRELESIVTLEDGTIKITASMDGLRFVFDIDGNLQDVRYQDFLEADLYPLSYEKVAEDLAPLTYRPPKNESF